MLCVDRFSPTHIYHYFYFNPAPGVKQDEREGFYSSWHQLVNRQAQTNYTHKLYSQPLHAVQLYWVLTDTSQQQLYPKQNRKNNNENDACRFGTIFCLCRAAIPTHSGCLSILLPQLNSCPLIYIPNLAIIKIPELLVNSLSLSSSTSYP